MFTQYRQYYTLENSILINKLYTAKTNIYNYFMKQTVLYHINILKIRERGY